MSYTAIASQTLTSSASSVTFSSIPGTFRDLVLVIHANSTGGTSYYLTLNNDTGSNYHFVWMSGSGSTTNSFALSNQTSLQYGYNAGFGTAVGHNAIWNFMDFSATNKHKSILTRSNTASSGVDALAQRWANTAAVTSLEIICNGNFAAGSTFSLYGVSA